MRSKSSLPLERLPRYGQALIESLRFDDANVALLSQLDGAEWQKLIALCDRTQLTLLVGCVGRSRLPESIRNRIEKDYRNNTTRFDRLQAAVSQIAHSLDAQSVEFTVLKGFTYAASFIGDPRLRSQGDIDLWCQGPSVFKARDALVDLGYKTIGRSKGRHLDPLIRETSWQWKGDYYAPDLPIPVDLHFKLWDQDMEHMAGPDEESVWERRSLFALPDDTPAWQLCLEDSLAFASLHAMMHLLHGDLRLQRAWEIAYFLQSHCDQSFWLKWQSLYSDTVRRPQVVMFAMVQEWFGGKVPALVQEERERLPQELQVWIKHYAWSPVESLFKPNKDELWLNLALIQSARHKSQVFIRRFLPVHALDMQAAALPEAGKGPMFAGATMLWQRGIHHVAMIPWTCLEAIRWWWRRQELPSQFLLFAVASGIFYFGEFVFFLLYNVYLVQCGFHEKTIGQIAAAVTLGTFVGAIPAAAFLRRFGLRKGLLVAIAGTAIAGVLRTCLLSPAWLDASAFFNGLSMCFWAVSLPPVVAGLTTLKNRTLAFSIVTAIGIGVGAIAGITGGALPGLLAKLNPAATIPQTSRAALLTGCVLLTFAVVPVSRLRIKSAPLLPSNGRTYPRNRFSVTFLITLFIWSLGTGGFNPFFNIYFSQYQHVSMNSLGFIFSLSQSSQVIAILVLPALMKAMGDVRSVATLQIVTGILLASLALVTSPVAAAAMYVGYTSFQYASEPYLLSLLMSGVQASEQKGASALYFMVTSLAGIIAASIAGAMLERVGYQPTMLVCAALTIVAASLYHRFVRV